MLRRPTRLPAFATAFAAAVATLLASCNGSSGEGSGSVTVQGDVSIAYAKRSTDLSINPTDGAPFAAGGA